MACITHSVGKHGSNLRVDVKVVQALLNLQLGLMIPRARLSIDGHAKGPTTDMIGDFQTRVMHMEHPTQLVDPGSATLKALRKVVFSDLTDDKLHAIMTNANNARVDRFLQPLLDGMTAYSINTPLRVAHFLAQLGHESGDLLYTQELASGAAYEGRKDLGNTEPGDGKRFKGRGLIQITGRNNYTAYGKYKNRDFTTGDNPLLLATDATLAVDASCWFWMTHKLNDWADKDDIRKITHKVNGGYNGLDDRKSHLERAKCLLVA